MLTKFDYNLNFLFNSKFKTSDVSISANLFDKFPFGDKKSFSWEEGKYSKKISDAWNDYISSSKEISSSKINIVLENKFLKNNLKNIEINENFIEHGTNWIYSFTENFYAFSFSIVSYFLESQIYQDNYNVSKKLYWHKTLSLHNSTLLLSMVLDQIMNICLLNMPFFNEFFKHFLTSSEFNNLFFYHPEYFFILKMQLLTFSNLYFSNTYLSNQLLTVEESFITPTLMLPQLLLLYFLVMLFFVIYFSYFNNPNTEDNIVDHDYLSFNVTIEAEEEIGSMDDMILSSVILLYIFLWFFWIYSWSSISITPQLTMSIYLFPFLYFIIFFIPCSLLYDYGSYFLTYLNGVGKSSILILELLFDYIAVSIFYLRLIVQNVRLVFMLFTYSELHELIIFHSTDKNILIGDDNYTSSWNGDKTHHNSFSYYLIFKLPVYIMNWLYELFHTFFMVIFQFVAFFAMIFWLFLFLYSMFVAELQENFFTDKRNIKKNIFNKITNYKLSLIS